MTTDARVKYKMLTRLLASRIAVSSERGLR